MKLGTEVEGRFKGLETLFVSAKEALDHLDREPEDLIARLNKICEGTSYKPLQVYISDHEGELNYLSKVLNTLSSLGLMVTLEVTEVGQSRDLYPKNVSLILSCTDTAEGSAYATSFFNLALTDQVKFSIGQYVFCATKETFMVTTPLDFDADEEVEPYQYL